MKTENESNIKSQIERGKRMNLFYIRYFVELAKEQQYTKAAKNLNITQPSLSHAIHQLEEELGVLLFEKTGRNTVLTRYGEEFLVYAENTIRTLDQGIRLMQKAAHGEGVIRLGFVRPLGMDFVPGLADDYRKRLQDEMVQFSFHTGTTHELVNGLKEKQYDIIFCSRPVDESGLSVLPVGRQDLVVITPEGHPLAEEKNVDLADTLKYPQIYFYYLKGNHDREDLLTGENELPENLRMFGYSLIGETPQIAYETEEDEVIAGLVAHNFGIAVVPYMKLLERLTVKILKLRKPRADRMYYMVCDATAYKPPCVQSFYDYVSGKNEMQEDKFIWNI